MYNFRLTRHTSYGTNVEYTHAVVFMQSDSHASVIDFLYKKNTDNRIEFFYEKNSCLSQEEKKELEKWFRNRINIK